mmetsp:Transcript_9838/g.37094  ORF Transcript_9838/g.37094 Transcript_9838/m.37094 type:complete len:316 (-) Transcript_9838:697-1644(-)
MKVATNGWRRPAVVRGLFKDPPAVDNWGDVDFLPSKIGDLVVPVHQNASLSVDHFELRHQTFGDAFRTIHQGVEPKYLFFPLQSRHQLLGNTSFSPKMLQKAVDDVVREDLQLERIHEGFGGPRHLTFFGTQLIVGHGTQYGALDGQKKVHHEDGKLTTGTGWHCALGNNWFVQVAGRKRWYFIDPKYSAYMGPAIGGEVNYQTILHDLSGVTPHLPVRFADIEPGDLIYNPDLEWHRIENYPGFSLGVPIREFHIERSFRNNALYTSFLIVDQILGKFGTNLGRPSCTDAKDCLRIWRQGYEAGAAYDETHNEL